MCAVRYKNSKVRVVGPLEANVCGIYKWAGFTTYYGRDYDYWQSKETNFTIWRSDKHHTYVIADTYPDVPGALDPFWLTYKKDPLSFYYAFGSAAGNCHIHETDVHQTEWEQWGMDRVWLVRSGILRAMHGQAFYPRCIWPPKYIDAYGSPHVKPETEAPIPDDQSCCWRPSDKAIFYHEFFADPQFPHGYTGISLFQIRPVSAGKTFERKHTHLIGSASPWPAQAGDNLISCFAHWQPPAGTQVRYFARAWAWSGFRHVGPAYTTVCVGHCTVTGTLNPDWTGEYRYAGLCNGFMSFSNKDGPGHLFWHGEPDWWYISETMGDYMNAGWWKTGIMVGEYAPFIEYEGTATVTYFPIEGP